MYVWCPDLSPPKPLDQSKNVTVRSYHKLSKAQNGPKNRQKFTKITKNAKNANWSTAPCSKARRSVVTSITRLLFPYQT